MSPLQRAAKKILRTFIACDDFYLCLIADELKKYDCMTKDEYNSFTKAVKTELANNFVYDAHGNLLYRTSVLCNVWGVKQKYGLNDNSPDPDRRKARIQWLKEIIAGKISYET